MVRIVRVVCGLVFILGACAVAEQPSSTAMGVEDVRAEALRITNDSLWAHTVTPTLQDSPCDHQNSVFPNLYPADEARQSDEVSPQPPPDAIQPDNSTYLIRFQSSRPVQDAFQRLVAMGDRSYDARFSRPPNTITVAVILKSPASSGATISDYAYLGNGEEFPSNHFEWKRVKRTIGNDD